MQGLGVQNLTGLIGTTLLLHNSVYIWIIFGNLGIQCIDYIYKLDPLIPDVLKARKERTRSAQHQILKPRA